MLTMDWPPSVINICWGRCALPMKHCNRRSALQVTRMRRHLVRMPQGGVDGAERQSRVSRSRFSRAYDRASFATSQWPRLKRMSLPLHLVIEGDGCSSVGATASMVRWPSQMQFCGLLTTSKSLPFKRSNGSQGYTVTGHALERLNVDQQGQPFI